MIGADRNSASQPRRKSRTAATATPDITARIPTRSPYRALPVEANTPSPAANSGAIVESAPTETCGLEPSSTKTRCRR